MKKRALKKRDFFISYTERDLNWALWVAETLSRYQKTVYIQTWDSPVGKKFREWMTEAIKSSGGFIFLWSEAYSNSHHCGQELDYADKMIKDGKIHSFLPIRLDNFPMKEEYSGITPSIVFSELNEDDAERELCHITGCQGHKRSVGLFPDTMRSYGDNFYKLAEILADDDNTYPIERDSNGSIQCFEQARELGSPHACLRLGNIYENRGNFETARKRYEEAVGRGVIEANLDLGRLYRNNAREIGLSESEYEERYRSSYNFYVKAGDEGAPEYLCALGFFYEHGFAGLEKDEEKALDYYQRAANIGNREAMMKLAEFYKYGKCGLPRDIRQAIDYYERAGCEELIPGEFEEAKRKYPIDHDNDTDSTIRKKKGDKEQYRKRLIVYEIFPDGIYVNLPGIYFQGFMFSSKEHSYNVGDEVIASAKVTGYDERDYLVLLEEVE